MFQLPRALGPAVGEEDFGIDRQSGRRFVHPLFRVNETPTGLP